MTPGSIRCLLLLGLALAGSPPPGHGSQGHGGNGPGKPATRHAYTEAHSGLACTWASQGAGSVVCGRLDGTGLRFLVSARIVRITTVGGSVLFTRRQPVHPRGPAREPGSGVSHRHVEDGLLCEWTSTGGGGVFCGSADRRGYAAGLLPSVATVVSGASDIVFIRKQQP